MLTLEDSIEASPSTLVRSLDRRHQDRELKFHCCKLYLYTWTPVRQSMPEDPKSLRPFLYSVLYTTSITKSSSQKHRYPTPPAAVIPTPIHHQRSALIGCFLLIRAFRFIGSVMPWLPSKPLFVLVLLVDLAAPLEVDVVGFKVWVGSICGGL